MTLKARKNDFNPEPVGVGASFTMDEIMEMIPHRPPMLMIDKVKGLEADKGAIGIKILAADSHVFDGHFPGKPVMPGVLIVEAMAQTAAVLVVKTLGDEVSKSIVYFMSIDQARFRRPVVPGNTLELHVKKKKNRGPVWKFTAQATVDGTVVAEAEFSAMLQQEKISE